MVDSSPRWYALKRFPCLLEQILLVGKNEIKITILSYPVAMTVIEKDLKLNRLLITL